MSAPVRPSYLQSVLSTTLLLLLLVASFPISLIVSSTVAVSNWRPSAEKRARKLKNETVLVTGARTTKSLVLARMFWKAGYRVVVADEQTWGWLSATRFSRCVSKYYDLPDPVTSHDAYERAIRHIIQKEGVKLWVPGSSAGGTLNDARVAEIVRKEDGIQAFIQSPKEAEALHNKDLFGDLCKDLGFKVPESILVTSTEEAVRFLHSDERQGKEYIIKTTALDDQGRSDLTRLPMASPSKTQAHLEKMPRRITKESPYVLQHFIEGYEFCTHCHAVDGVMQSFLTCPSSDMLMRYLDCRTAFSYPIAESAEKWTRSFLTAWKKKLQSEGKQFHLTGHFSFDFMVDPSGTLYPIECNPRIHTAIVLLSDLGSDQIAASYFGEAKNSVIRPNESARSRFSWMFHAIPIALGRALFPRRIQDMIHPLLRQTLSWPWYEAPVPAVTISPPVGLSVTETVMDYVSGSEKDPMLDSQDPFPFAAQHIMWVWLLVRLVFIQGKGWSRVNVSTSRLFSC